VPVGVDGELLADHVGQGVDLRDQALESGDEGAGDVHRGRPEVAG